jgi:hypothetical protein
MKAQLSISDGTHAINGGDNRTIPPMKPYCVPLKSWTSGVVRWMQDTPLNVFKYSINHPGIKWGSINLHNRSAVRIKSNANIDLNLCHSGLRLVVLLTTMLLGCSPPESQEIGRYVSPDKRVDAVLVELKTGVMIATPTKLFLVPAGKDWSADSPILLGDYFEELRIVWLRPDLLEIHYKKGRIFSFASFWASKDVEMFKHLVELRLVPESDSTIPKYGK